MCGANSTQVRLQVDHIRPVAEGGTDQLDNLGTLCEDCNRGKAAHSFADYRQLPYAMAPPESPDRKFALWRAALGQHIRIDPLKGHPQWSEPDSWFLVRDVTPTSIRLFKRSSHHNVTLPLACVGEPWGSENEGGLRATVQQGTLRFVVDKKCWEWFP